MHLSAFRIAILFDIEHHNTTLSINLLHFNPLAFMSLLLHLEN